MNISAPGSPRKEPTDRPSSVVSEILNRLGILSLVLAVIMYYNQPENPSKWVALLGIGMVAIFASRNKDL